MEFKRKDMLHQRSPDLYFTLCLLYMAADLYAQPADGVINRYSTEIRCDMKRLSVKTTLVLQVNNRDGERLAEFRIPYTKKNRITQLKASIHDAGGQLIRELGKKQIRDESVFTEDMFYSDAFNKTFELKHNVFPYLIELEYLQEFDEFCLVADWTPIFHSAVPTLKASLDLQIPPDYKVNIFTSKVKTSIPNLIDHKMVYHWEASYDTVWPDESCPPPFGKSLPRVIVSPVEFFYGVSGNMADWRSFGNFRCDLMKGRDVLPPEELNVQAIACPSGTWVLLHREEKSWP